MTPLRILDFAELEKKLFDKFMTLSFAAFRDYIRESRLEHDLSWTVKIKTILSRQFWRDFRYWYQNRRKLSQYFKRLHDGDWHVLSQEEFRSFVLSALRIYGYDREAALMAQLPPALVLDLEALPVAVATGLDEDDASMATALAREAQHQRDHLIREWYVLPVWGPLRFAGQGGKAWDHKKKGGQANEDPNQKHQKMSIYDREADLDPLWQILASFPDYPVVGHNAREHDCAILNQRRGDLCSGPVADTWDISFLLSPWQTERTLQGCLRAYHGRKEMIKLAKKLNFASLHSAEGDCQRNHLLWVDQLLDLARIAREDFAELYEIMTPQQKEWWHKRDFFAQIVAELTHEDLPSPPTNGEPAPNKQPQKHKKGKVSFADWADVEGVVWHLSGQSIWRELLSELSPSEKDDRASPSRDRGGYNIVLEEQIVPSLADWERQWLDQFVLAPPGRRTLWRSALYNMTNPFALRRLSAFARQSRSGDLRLAPLSPGRDRGAKALGPQFQNRQLVQDMIDQLEPELWPEEPFAPGASEDGFAALRVLWHGDVPELACSQDTERIWHRNKNFIFEPFSFYSRAVYWPILSYYDFALSEKDAGRLLLWDHADKQKHSVVVPQNRRKGAARLWRYCQQEIEGNGKGLVYRLVHFDKIDFAQEDIHRISVFLDWLEQILSLPRMDFDAGAWSRLAFRYTNGRWDLLFFDQQGVGERYFRGNLLWQNGVLPEEPERTLLNSLEWPAEHYSGPKDFFDKPAALLRFRENMPVRRNWNIWTYLSGKLQAVLDHLEEGALNIVLVQASDSLEDYFGVLHRLLTGTGDRLYAYPHKWGYSLGQILERLEPSYAAQKTGQGALRVLILSWSSRHLLPRIMERWERNDGEPSPKVNLIVAEMDRVWPAAVRQNLLHDITEGVNTYRLGKMSANEREQYFVNQAKFLDKNEVTVAPETFQNLEWKLRLTGLALLRREFAGDMVALDQRLNPLSPERQHKQKAFVQGLGCQLYKEPPRSRRGPQRAMVQAMEDYIISQYGMPRPQLEERRIDQLAHGYMRRVFGHRGFRELNEDKSQLDAIKAVFQNKNLIVLAATGLGKSLLFQLPALIYAREAEIPFATLVISPLVTLMKDQENALRSRGIFDMASLYGDLDEEEKRRRLDAYKKGSISILYVAPERLHSQSFARVLGQRPPSLLVVDEAHCISQWGHDFRPVYQELVQKVQESIGAHPYQKIAVTATARQGDVFPKDSPMRIYDNVLDDIKNSLRLNEESLEFIASTTKRPELVYQVCNLSPHDALQSDKAWHEVSENYQAEAYRELITFMDNWSSELARHLIVPEQAGFRRSNIELERFLADPQQEDHLPPILAEAKILVFANDKQYLKAVIKELTQRKEKQQTPEMSKITGFGFFRFAKYDADMPKEEKEDIQHRFGLPNSDPDSINLILATNAFGMGVDVSHIRAVLHLLPPMDAEAYYQEAGRAGRDGQPALCRLYYQSAFFNRPGSDDSFQKFFVLRNIFHYLLAESRDKAVESGVKVVELPYFKLMQQVMLHENRSLREQEGPIEYALERLAKIPADMPIIKDNKIYKQAYHLQPEQAIPSDFLEHAPPERYKPWPWEFVRLGLSATLGEDPLAKRIPQWEKSFMAKDIVAITEQLKQISPQLTISHLPTRFVVQPINDSHLSQLKDFLDYFARKLKNPTSSLGKEGVVHYYSKKIFVSRVAYKNLFQKSGSVRLLRLRSLASMLSPLHSWLESWEQLSFADHNRYQKIDGRFVQETDISKKDLLSATGEATGRNQESAEAKGSVPGYIFYVKDFSAHKLSERLVGRIYRLKELIDLCYQALRRMSQSKFAAVNRKEIFGDAWELIRELVAAKRKSAGGERLDYVERLYLGQIEIVLNLLHNFGWLELTEEQEAWNYIRVELNAQAIKRVENKGSSFLDELMLQSRGQYIADRFKKDALLYYARHIEQNEHIEQIEQSTQNEQREHFAKNSFDPHQFFEDYFLGRYDMHKVAAASGCSLDEDGRIQNFTNEHYRLTKLQNDIVQARGEPLYVNQTRRQTGLTEVIAWRLIQVVHVSMAPADRILILTQIHNIKGNAVTFGDISRRIDFFVPGLFKQIQNRTFNSLYMGALVYLFMGEGRLTQYSELGSILKDNIAVKGFSNVYNFLHYLVNRNSQELVLTENFFVKDKRYLEDDLRYILDLRHLRDRVTLTYSDAVEAIVEYLKVRLPLSENSPQDRGRGSNQATKYSITYSDQILIPLLIDSLYDNVYVNFRKRFHKLLFLASPNNNKIFDRVFQLLVEHTNRFFEADPERESRREQDKDHATAPALRPDIEFISSQNSDKQKQKYFFYKDLGVFRSYSDLEKAPDPIPPKGYRHYVLTELMEDKDLFHPYMLYLYQAYTGYRDYEPTSVKVWKQAESPYFLPLVDLASFVKAKAILMESKLGDEGRIEIWLPRPKWTERNPVLESDKGSEESDRQDEPTTNQKNFDRIVSLLPKDLHKRVQLVEGDPPPGNGAYCVRLCYLPQDFAGSLRYYLSMGHRGNLANYVFLLEDDKNKDLRLFINKNQHHIEEYNMDRKIMEERRKDGVVITTMGTALKRNYDSWRQGRRAGDFADGESDLGMADYIQWLSSEGREEKLCPEIKGNILLEDYLKEHGFAAIKKIHLIRSNSSEIETIYPVMKDYFAARGYEVADSEVKSLRGDAESLSDKSIKELIEILNDAIDKYQSDYHVMMNVTGGYKAETSYASMVGQLRAVDSYYVYEKSQKIMPLPALPITLDQNFWLSYREEFDLFYRGLSREKGQDLLANLDPQIRNFVELENDQYRLNSSGYLYYQNVLRSKRGSNNKTLSVLIADNNIFSLAEGRKDIDEIPVAELRTILHRIARFAYVRRLELGPVEQDPASPQAESDNPPSEETYLIFEGSTTLDENYRMIRYRLYCPAGQQLLYVKVPRLDEKDFLAMLGKKIYP